MADEYLKFDEAVEIRRQEMHSILPGMQTTFTFKGKSAVIRSATIQERSKGNREGKVVR